MVGMVGGGGNHKWLWHDPAILIRVIVYWYWMDCPMRSVVGLFGSVVPCPCHLMMMMILGIVWLISKRWSQSISAVVAVGGDPFDTVRFLRILMMMILMKRIPRTIFCLLVRLILSVTDSYNGMVSSCHGPWM